MNGIILIVLLAAVLALAFAAFNLQKCQGPGGRNTPHVGDCGGYPGRGLRLYSL